MVLDLVEARDSKDMDWSDLFGAKWCDVLEELFSVNYSIAMKDH